MMYYIGTQEQLQDYNTKVTNGEGYNGTTTRWAEVIEHPDGNQFAMIKHTAYTSDDNLTEQESLSSDWFPEEV